MEVDTSALRSQLIDWYHDHRRDLPWRRTRDPYAIWVSEVMLQQTRVDTVIPFYERFLARWPSPTALADADSEEVRAAWSGLGYYRRAASMLSAARTIRDELGGTLPSDPEALRALPGFGPYTTGAVASMAFDKAVPAIDGNVSRVLARVGAIEGDVTRGPAAAAVEALATALVPGPSPGDLNQALIELGALICKRPPQCSICPVRKACGAFLTQKTDLIPPPRKRKAPRRVELSACVLLDPSRGGRRILLAERPVGQPFAGLWTPPLWEGKLTLDQAEARTEGDWGERIPLRHRGDIVHVLTHRRLEVQVFVGSWPKGQSTPVGHRLLGLDALSTVGLPSFTVKLLQCGIPPEQLPAQLPGRGRHDPPTQRSLPLGEDALT